MDNPLNLWKIPEAEEVYLLAGWRQWADGGSVSSGLPDYLVEKLHAERIGVINPDGFYIFQVPGTHDLVRPTVKFEEGLPTVLETPHNDFYFFQEGSRILVIFLGDEPHMDVERYVAALLQAARELGARLIIGLGGVYGELPYDKERMISCNYSLPRMKEGASRLMVGLSDYLGGASIGSVVCRRAGDHELEYIGLYALVPAYDLSEVAHFGSVLRVENDYRAWLGIMRRVNYLCKLHVDLADLEKKSIHLVETMNAKIEEIDRELPKANLRERITKITSEFKEMPFIPLNDAIEDELRRLLDKFGEGDGTNADPG
jgi:proteasome assembly chaperone (PAC2) family protein